MKKVLTISGRIHNMSRITGELMVTLHVPSGTYVNMAVGDLPITQEEIEANVGNMLTVKVEAEIDNSLCSEHGHIDDGIEEQWVHCARCGQQIGHRIPATGALIPSEPNLKLAQKT